MSKSQAGKLYTDFTEFPAEIEFDGDVPQPTTLNALGQIIHVVYISDKWAVREARMSKKDRFIRYIHAFERSAPTLCYDSKNDFYHIVGKVAVKPEGIMDYRGKSPGNKGSNANYSIPKEMTYLGGLEEISYESLDDGQDYRIDFDKKCVLCSNPRGDQLYIAKLKN